MANAMLFWNSVSIFMTFITLALQTLVKMVDSTI
jgi:hypothetical protein